MALRGINKSIDPGEGYGFSDWIYYISCSCSINHPARYRFIIRYYRYIRFRYGAALLV
jgi:hypothetical protein